VWFISVGVGFIFRDRCIFFDIESEKVFGQKEEVRFWLLIKDFCGLRGGW
jgi:hypothetical protein